MLRQLITISSILESQYIDEDDPWGKSPFGWIKKRPSRQIGAIGERFVDTWLSMNGCHVSRGGDSQADRSISGIRVEIKFSTIWKDGAYRFQQIRDQDYSHIVCLGLSPLDAHCWVVPKAEIMRLWKIEKIIESQHGGNHGTDTAWVRVDPLKIPAWIEPFGGSLESAIRILRKIAGIRD
jgi:hypothetical protein